MKKDKVCVIGLGYIGLPTAATLASNNFEVYGYDINEDIYLLMYLFIYLFILLITVRYGTKTKSTSTTINIGS